MRPIDNSGYFFDYGHRLYTGAEAAFRASALVNIRLIPSRNRRRHAAIHEVTYMKQQESKKSLSAKQLAASRNNGNRSAGPKSEAGKRRSSQNAYKHGFYAKFLFPTDELLARDGEEYNRILTAYRSLYSPAGDMENYYVEQIAVHSLRLARLLGHEQKVLAWKAPFECRSPGGIIRYESSISRMLEKTIDRLERLQLARQAELSQLDSSNMEQDDTPSDDEASEEVSEARPELIPEEPQDVGTSGSVPAASPTTAQQHAESNAEQELPPADGQQAHAPAEAAVSDEPTGVSPLVNIIEKATGLPPLEEGESSLESRENHGTDSIGSSNFLESREDGEMIGAIERGDDQKELGCI
jgi:hypothetical protein